MTKFSKNTQIRISIAAATSLTSALATRLVTGNRFAPLLMGASVLATHASSVAGDVIVGKILSRTRAEVRNQERKIKNAKDNNAKNLSDVLESIDNAEEKKLETPSPTQSTASHDANPEGIKKVVSKNQISAADPKSRRPGHPPHHQTSAALIKSRTHVPITGENAKRWIEGRTGKSMHQPVESTPSFRLGRIPLATDIRVAMIADDFTYHSYSYEFDIRRLTPENWRQTFEEHKPQMFFCESAWQGGDPKSRPWQGKIYASVRWPLENRKVLLEILEYCHTVGIPTVFWNKEDPTHFGDRVNDFIRTAALFDYVFTTAEECVESYRRDADIQNINVLPFAVQPRLFNPQGIRSASQSVNFAGTWYVNYRARCESAAAIMDQVIEAGLDLIIYDRMYNSPHPDYRYPDRYLHYTRPAIPYTRIPQSYKQSKFGITLNTVTNSKTMFARRAFELAASGSVVLSNYAEGVYQFFGDSVLYPDLQPGVLKEINEFEYQDLQKRAMDIALQHTYAHRAEEILDIVGIEYQSQFKKPTGLVFLRNEREYESAFANFAKNPGLTDLLVVVSDGQEQSLQMRLMMRRDAGVTVLSNEELRNGDFRVRNYLSTPGIVGADENFDWPAQETIQRIMSHSTHFNGAIREAVDGEDRYRTTTVDNSSGVYIPAELVGNFFSGAGELSLFEV